MLQPTSMKCLSRLLLVLVLLGSTTSSVFAEPDVIWSRLLPNGLSEQTGTLSTDSTFVMADGVIALGTAPCPALWRCPDSWHRPQTFWALDANTGKVKWTIPLANGSTIEPIAAQKLILGQYARPNGQGDTTYRLLALDPQTGRIVWSIPGSGWALVGDLILRSDENSDNWGVITNASLSAYDVSNGMFRWRINTLPASYSLSSNRDFGYGAGIIFTLGETQLLYSQSTLLYALNASTGAVIWSRNGFSSGACPTYSDGRVFAVQLLQGPSSLSFTRNLVALNATIGQTLWNKTIGYSYYDTNWKGENPNVAGVCPMIGKDRVFDFSIKTHDQLVPDLVAFDSSDGRELWRHPVPCEADPIDLTTCRPILWNHRAVSQSMVFMASGYLHAIDQNSGSEVWSYGLTVDNWNPLGYQNGVLYAFDTPNNVTSPSIAAFAFPELPVPEVPINHVTEILVAALLCTLLIVVRTGSAGLALRKRIMPNRRRSG